MEDKYQVGAILDSSWGYDQTNYDFYRIQRRTNDTVWLLPLQAQQASNGPASMTGTCVPGEPKEIGAFEVGAPGCKFDGTLLRRRLCRDRQTGEIRGLSIEHGWCSLWDGKPCHFSSYA